ncbi:GbsR/MarR family transcriptional regulator [Thermobifida halotolerans]|uniref:GbsR/MarR family transcriptional regulator n=1 Tax=Thermobifida halotolerans TaxID=483545 RepID=UPI00083908FD|nr:winged helix DNA-binding protein [Thermobifida halotolerans]
MVHNDYVPPGSPRDPTEQERHYVEEVAVVLERMGLVRMHGRVVGWLLVCDPPEQSASDISAALQASKGSISPALRFLRTAGWIEKVPRPGQRRDYYRITPNAWSTMLRQQTPVYAVFTELAARGLDEFRDEPPGRLLRLREMHQFFTWIQEEIPNLVERWLAWQREHPL